MGILNVPQDEADAIKAVDSVALEGMIDRCIDAEHPTAIRSLGLRNCGPYISTRLHAFELSLADHAKAKAAKKRTVTEYDVRKAGRYLAHAVQEMKHRVASEEQERKLFFVEDQIAGPALISQHLSVTVRYRWRVSMDQEWQYGSVKFSHEVKFHRDYSVPVPARKPSAAQQRRDREAELYRQWEYLRDLGLQQVRDHFRRGESGATIPEEVQAKVDPHTHHLNNFSARF